MNNPWVYFSKNRANYHHNASFELQEKWLKDCINSNKHSLYGERYQFQIIKNIKAFQENVPLVDYEALVPWIDKISQGELNVLFSGKIIAFEKTGGSQSGGKLIPYSENGLNDFRHALLNWLASIINQFEIKSGKAYFALSPALHEKTLSINNIPIGGGDALYLGADNLEAFSSLSAVPLSVGAITDFNNWQILTLFYLICAVDLRLISIWSPSFFIELLNALITHKEKIIKLLTVGGDIGGHLLKKDLTAKKRLENYLKKRETAILWPNLSLLSAWSHASSEMLAKELISHFPNIHFQPKGLLSTEAIITLPDDKGALPLCIVSNFYEFIDFEGSILLFNELSHGAIYEVVVTTNSGLYRYKTNDLILCKGYQNGVPIFEFIGRKGIVSDLIGEKLTESFVNQTLSSIKGFAMLAPDQETQQGYILLLDRQYYSQTDPLITDIEKKLCDNPQYAHGRKLGQLAPLVSKAIDQPTKKYLDYQIKQIKTLGDIKIPALLHKGDWKVIFNKGEKHDTE